MTVNQVEFKENCELKQKLRPKDDKLRRGNGGLPAPLHKIERERERERDI
jgi:hypothetical protein